MEVKKCFGLLLKNKRKEKRYSQQRLADMAQLNRTYISLIERGIQAPTIVTILKISKALEIKPSMLIMEFEKELESTEKPPLNKI